MEANMTMHVSVRRMWAVKAGLRIGGFVVRFISVRAGVAIANAAIRVARVDARCPEVPGFRQSFSLPADVRVDTDS